MTSIQERITNIEKDSTKLLLLLLITDCVFIFLHILFVQKIISDPMLWLERDRGYGEVFQYIKELWIIILLTIIAVKEEDLIYYAWIIMFTYLIIDDSFEIHERVGGIMKDFFGFKRRFGMRGQDFGELTVSLIAATVLFSIIGVSYILSKKDRAKKVARDLFAFLLAIAFLGVAVDMFHSRYRFGGTAYKIIAVIEDGGEMILMSFVAWYLFSFKSKENESGYA